MAGKGSKPRPVDMSKAVIYCEHGRFKDRCIVCETPLINFYIKLKENIYFMGGKPYWKYKQSNKVLKDNLAGSLRKGNYRVIKVTINKKYKYITAHRLLWYMTYNRLPKIGIEIDHINRNPDDNRIENLREVTSSQNNYNSVRKNKSSKYKGVHYCKRDRVWRATLTIDRKQLYIGGFKDEELAGIAYNKAVIKHGLSDFIILNNIKNHSN